ncbi:MAG: 23S rRNA (guanosine(2251)-2'-O)-methyltransferase RlmB [Saprospiraceae bacterium]|nr:23S rRNA (guanosine(2251)-2'-O)-methyltransferase RlmB [Saprospiraceae bacterium]
MSDIIFGKNPVLEAFDAGADIEKIFMLSTLRGELEVSIRNLCRDRQIPLAKVPEVKLNELSKNRNHQGVVAIISPVNFQNIKDVIALIYEEGNVPLIVIADGVNDVRNLGALARSAYFFGAHALVFSGNMTGRINEDTVKTSAGAILKIPVCRAQSLFNLISDLQNSGIHVVAAGLKSEKSVDKIDFKVPTALLLGSEEKGLHYKVYEVVDDVATIPAVNAFDSLNVSVAGGILLYEVVRQRTLSD